MTPVLYVGINCDGSPSPEFAVPQFAEAELPDYANYTPGICSVGPLKVAPGGLVSGVTLAQHVDKPIGLITLAELVVSNVDASSHLVLSVTNVDLSGQPANFDMSSEMWGGIHSQSGSDLVVSADGQVRSTGGGVYWQTLIVNLAPAIR